MALKKSILSALAALLLLTSAQGGQAEELTGTLKKIKETGVIVVGHRESSVPFSYYDLQQNVIGYAQDYSSKVVDVVKKQLNMPTFRFATCPSPRRTVFP